MQLTEEQRRVVRHERGHALVSAVAGSGKTTTMVARVGHLLDRGCEPGALLVLMFNRSASRHFFSSLHRRLAGRGHAAPQVRTFHALGLRLVESFTRRGALPSFTLAAEEHRREKLARQALGEAYKKEFGAKTWPSGEDIELFLGFIDLVKSTTSSVAQCFNDLKIDQNYRYFLDGFTAFEELRRRSGIRFYEDLIHEPLLAMLKDHRLAEWVTNRVDHIIVDEYQDINEAQQQLLRMLAGDRAQVMVVGDVDQCIYEWRGARPEYITSRFHHDFPNPVSYTLSYTFRFGHRLSLAANHLIGNNRLRDRKLCLSASGTGDTRLEWREEGEPHPLLAEIAQWRQAGRRLEEITALIRLFAASVPLELALLEAGIPYRLEGHERVFQCREIKALIGYLRLCTGALADDERQARADFLQAMLSQPHLGLRQEELEKLALEIADNLPEAPERIVGRADAEMPAFLQKKLEQAAIDWDWLMRRPAGGRAERLLNDIISRLALYEFYTKFSVRQAAAENRIATCAAFVDFAARLGMETPAFLLHLQELEQKAEAQGGDSLLITSIHRAKGCEWPLVVVCGLQDGLFPFLADGVDGMAEGSIEDERRLFYVAMTRAIERLVLIHPPDRLLTVAIAAGRSRSLPETIGASRFLYEANLGLSDRLGAAIAAGRPEEGGPVVAEDIAVAGDYLLQLGRPPELVRQSATAAVKPKKTKITPARVLRMNEIGEGLEVMHRVFGRGIVTAVLDRSQGQIRVVFEPHGEKTLLVSLAKLEPVA